VVRELLSGIAFRAALPADAYALAELSIMAGDGMYEFLLEEMVPKEMLAGLVARSMKQDAGGSCWRHCLVADDKGVLGMINAFPAAWLRAQERDLLPGDRVQILDPIDQAQDWESYLINSVAVRREQRRHGIAGRLVKWAIEQATVAGFTRLSVNVWADNVAAAALFEEEGFCVQTRIDVPEHPRLSHVGGSLLMLRHVDVSGTLSTK
jgi:ribosomal protein S18 acetylase RimI-like enzyme